MQMLSPGKCLFILSSQLPCDMLEQNTKLLFFFFLFCFSHAQITSSFLPVHILDYNKGKGKGELLKSPMGM